MKSIHGREFTGAKSITHFKHRGYLCHYLDCNVHPGDLLPGDEYLVKTEDGRYTVGGDGAIVGICEPLTA
jgi:hypothetical protein